MLLAVFLPAGFIQVLHRRVANGRRGLGVRHRQGGADFLFQVGHRAQRDRHAEDVFTNLFDAAFAQALIAGQITDDAGQMRTGHVGQHVGRDRGPRHFAATRARVHGLGAR